MLNDNELSKFFALLLGFATALGLSDRGMATLLDISHKTMSRWMNAARATAAVQPNGSPTHNVYRHLAVEATHKLIYLKGKCSPEEMMKIPSRGQRLQSLKDMLAKRTV